MRHGGLFLLSVSLGCTGMTLGENSNGMDTWLDPDDPIEGEHTTGALAVEEDEDHVYTVHSETRNGVTRSHLAAITPTGAVRDVLDVTDTTDRRIVFPSVNRALVMAQKEAREQLILIDTDNQTEIRRTTKSTYYWGTRRSPSGKFMAVADNRAAELPLHLVDLATLEHVVVPHDGDSIEAMWNHAGDQLLAVSVKTGEDGVPSARFLRWAVTDPNVWPDADLDVTLPGYRWDFLFSFTWIGISPNDRWAVFPLIAHDTGEHVLVVLDQADGTFRTVAGRGPVGFTPDGSSIVSYGYDEMSSGVLYMIDPLSLETEMVPVPIAGGLSFFVTWDGNFVVCTSVFDDGRLVIYDPATSEASQVTGPYAALTEFVTRPGHHELWLAYNRLLHRLRLDDAVLEVVSAPFEVRHVNILPVADRLVLSEDGDAQVAFFDLATTSVQRIVDLPSPIDDPL